MYFTAFRIKIQNVIEHNSGIFRSVIVSKGAGIRYQTVSYTHLGQHGITNPDAPKAIARHEILCTLEDVIQKAAILLKPGGNFYMVHRPVSYTHLVSFL